MNISVFGRRSSYSGGFSTAQTCVTQMRSKPASQCTVLMTEMAKRDNKTPLAFAKECLEHLNANTPKDQELRAALGALIKSQSPMSEHLAERATVPEPSLPFLSERSYTTSEVVVDGKRENADKSIRSVSLPESPSVLKNYETSIFKRDQSERVVRHAQKYPEHAKNLFATYITTGKSGSEARIQKLAQSIQDTHYTVSGRLESVLTQVLAESMAVKGAEVSQILVNSGGFVASFDEVSAENKLSGEAGLKQFSKDFERGVALQLAEGVGLDTLSESEKVFIGRFANQQSVAAMVDQVGGALSVPSHCNEEMSGSGFRLDGWNTETEGVGYHVTVTQDQIHISIPATIAIKPVVLLDLRPMPICTATLEMTLSRTSRDCTVGVSFQPL